MSTITMNSMGEVIFKENGRIVTDPSEITYIKRHSDWKSKVYQLSLSLMNEIDSEIEKNISIYKRIPKMVTENDIQAEISSLICKEYSIEPYKKASFQEINNNAVRETNRYAKVNVSLLPFYKRKIEERKIATSKLQEFIDFYADKDADLEKEYYEKENLRKSEKDKEYKDEFDLKKNLLMKRILNNEADINSLLKDTLNSLGSNLPSINVNGSYNQSLNNTCLLNLSLPSKNCIESRKGNMLQSGKISVKNRSEKEITHDWEICCYGLLLYIAGVVFNVNTSINNVLINAQYSEINRVTGRNETIDFENCNFKRTSFETINWNNIDPELTVKAFSIGNTSQPSKIKKAANSKLKVKQTKAKYEIENIDELSGTSLDIIFVGLKNLIEKYSISILEKENRSRFLGAVKDLLPKNEAEQQFLEICINNCFFELLIDSSKKQEAISLFIEIASNNNLSNYQIFLDNMDSLL